LNTTEQPAGQGCGWLAEALDCTEALRIAVESGQWDEASRLEECRRSLLDRFFARVHTPVQPTPEADAAAVEASCADPGKFESDKLFPGTGWEIMKPARSDYIGFFGTWPWSASSCCCSGWW
jgi:hypothetical protein